MAIATDFVLGENRFNFVSDQFDHRVSENFDIDHKLSVVGNINGNVFGLVFNQVGDKWKLHDSTGESLRSFIFEEIMPVINGEYSSKDIEDIISFVVSETLD